MPAYKNKDNGTWYVMTQYTNWKGERKPKCKRGFDTKREAQEWEHTFRQQNSGDLDMPFSAFVEIYCREQKPRLKESTWQTKENIIQQKILPYFENYKINEITTKDVRAWQNEMLAYRNEENKPYSSSYLKTLHNQLSAIFNYAVRFYDLRSNPAAKAGNMGSEERKEMLFWTKEEYQKFSEVMMDKPISYYAFQMLYWTGIREGELLALTPADFDFEKGTVKISKTYQRIKGEDMLPGAEAASAKICAADEAGKLKAACEASAAVCTSLTREKKTIAPPKLFDLTSLQREANRIYGYTAKQTLDLAQTLYEKKLLTYPRTDSNYLTDDMGDTAAGIVSLLCGKLPFMAGVSFTPEVSRVLNSKKVSDHHAIIPTMEIAKTDLTTLPESERNILILTGARLLMATAEPHVYEAVTAVFSCADHEFTARGKTVIAAGWKNMERLYRATLKKKPDSDDEENELALDVPDYTEGQTFENPAAAVTEHDTTPPKPHNEASLLSAMERAGNEDTDPDAERRGLGTPATRAAVIEKLVKGGFIERKGKQLLPTKDGTNLVCVLPDSLTSPQLTAAWENNLTQIAKGNADPAAFMQGIEAMAQELVKTYASVLGEKQELFKAEKTELGKCPRCKSPVYEGKKNYYCSNKECSFTMWKNDRFFEERKTVFTRSIAAALLKSGKATVKKLYSPKTGKTYDGTVLLADTGGKYVNYKVTISKDKQLE